MSKARLSKLEALVLKYSATHPPSNDFLQRWLEARSRGMVLCKDGVERTEEDWIKTLPPKLQETISRLQEK